MTQQSSGPMSGQPGRPGRMTAVMRAMPVATGPKVLRIGLVQGGKVIEERVIKQRTTVSVGPSEKNTFVVLGPNLPASFKLFELVGTDYHLNFIDGMTGRIALATGPTDLASLRGQAKRNAQGAYQVRIGEDARGKVVVGETTFLFQFVAPPPVQPKPQLPSSVKSGVAETIDWSMTIIAAFSFLFHFGVIGTLYSDWADKVLPDEADVRGLVDNIRRLPPPPPPETPKEDSTDKAADKGADKPQVKAPAGGPKGPQANGKPAMSQAQGAALLDKLAQMDAATIGALSNDKSATAGVLNDGNVPTGQLDQFAKSGDGIGSTGPGGLRIGGGGGAVGPGGRGGLSDIAGTGTSKDSGGTGTTQAIAAPKANVGGGGSVSSGKISGAERVIAGAKGRIRGCYQSGLNSNPDMEGRVTFTLTIGGSGSVSNASVSPSGSLSGGVVSCIQGVLRSLNFDAPEGGAASVTGNFSFVNQTKGKLPRRRARPSGREPGGFVAFARRFESHFVCRGRTPVNALGHVGNQSRRQRFRVVYYETAASRCSVDSVGRGVYTAFHLLGRVFQHACFHPSLGVRRLCHRRPQCGRVRRRTRARRPGVRRRRHVRELAATRHPLGRGNGQARRRARGTYRPRGDDRSSHAREGTRGARRGSHALLERQAHSARRNASVVERAPYGARGRSQPQGHRALGARVHDPRGLPSAIRSAFRRGEPVCGQRSGPPRRYAFDDHRRPRHPGRPGWSASCSVRSGDDSPAGLRQPFDVRQRALAP